MTGRRWLFRLAGLLVLVLVGMAGVWAGRTALAPPPSPLPKAEPLTYLVEEGMVERSLAFSAVAEWELQPVGWNGASGVVTSINVENGAEVVAGQVLYTVDLRPVVAAVGEVPSFRDLGLNSEGADVAQLQQLLFGLGWFDDEVDGEFDASTRAAVREWQQSMDFDDGLVRAGDIVYLSSLPARLALASEHTVGARVSGGEELVLAVPADPMFRVPLSSEQRNLVPLSGNVRVEYPDGVWEGVIDGAVEETEGELSLLLTGDGGGPLCGSVCADYVGLGVATDFPVEIVVIPPTEGPVVPVAAIQTDAANQTFVTSEEGSRIDVEIMASTQGLAVVRGLEIGTMVQIPSTGATDSESG